MIDYENATFEQRIAICHISKALHLGLDRTGIDAMLMKIVGRDNPSPFTRNAEIAKTLIPDVFGPKGLTLKVAFTETSAGNVICEIEYSDGETMIAVEDATAAWALVKALSFVMHDGLAGHLVDFAA